MMESKDVSKSCGCFVLMVLALMFFPAARLAHGITYAILSIIFLGMLAVLLLTLAAKVWLKLMSKLGWFKNGPND